MSDLVNDRVIQALMQLRLQTAAEMLPTHLRAAADRDFSPLEFVDHLLADELAARQERSITVRTKLAHLPVLKSLDSFDFDAQPSLDRKVVTTLQSLHSSIAPKTSFFSDLRALEKRISQSVLAFAHCKPVIASISLRLRTCSIRFGSHNSTAFPAISSATLIPFHYSSSTNSATSSSTRPPRRGSFN